MIVRNGIMAIYFTYLPTSISISKTSRESYTSLIIWPHLNRNFMKHHLIHIFKEEMCVHMKDLVSIKNDGQIELVHMLDRQS